MTVSEYKEKAYRLAQCFQAADKDFCVFLETVRNGLSVKEAYILTNLTQIYYNYLCGYITPETGKRMIERCLEDEKDS